MSPVSSPCARSYFIQQSVAKLGRMRPDDTTRDRRLAEALGFPLPAGEMEKAVYATKNARLLMGAASFARWEVCQRTGRSYEWTDEIDAAVSKEVAVGLEEQKKTRAVAVGSDGGSEDWTAVVSDADDWSSSEEEDSESEADDEVEEETGSWVVHVSRSHRLAIGPSDLKVRRHLARTGGLRGRRLRSRHPVGAAGELGSPAAAKRAREAVRADSTSSDSGEEEPGSEDSGDELYRGGDDDHWHTTKTKARTRKRQRKDPQAVHVSPELVAIQAAAKPCRDDSGGRISHESGATSDQPASATKLTFSADAQNMAPAHGADGQELQRQEDQEQEQEQGRIKVIWLSRAERLDGQGYGSFGLPLCLAGCVSEGGRAAPGLNESNDVQVGWRVSDRTAFSCTPSPQ